MPLEYRNLESVAGLPRPAERIVDGLTVVSNSSRIDVGRKGP
jgi:hypothetical protein